MKRTKKLLAVLLAVVLSFSSFGFQINADTSTMHWAPALHNSTTDSRYTSAIWNSYSTESNSVVGSPTYNGSQKYNDVVDNNLLNKSHSPYIAFMVIAPEDGSYVVQPVYQVGSLSDGSFDKYNMVLSVNDADYYTCRDISYTGGTQWISGEDITVTLKKGVNVIRMLSSLKRPENVWVNINCLYVDGSCTVMQCYGNELTLNAVNSSYISNWPVAGSNLGNISQGNATMRSEKITYGIMNNENFAKVPYFSYTVDAPESGYYDISLNYNVGGSAYAGTGYFVVRVGGNYYKCNFQNVDDGYNVANISVPLEKGTNVISVTSAMELTSYNTDYYQGYPDWCDVTSLTIYGGVTKSATQINPTTIADEELPEVVVDGETYGILNRYSVSSNEYGLESGKHIIGDLQTGPNNIQSLASMQNDGYLDKSQIPYVSYMVNATEKGAYKLEAVFCPSFESGYNAEDYYMVISVNDRHYYKAYYNQDPNASNWSRSQITVELDKGVNVIRCMSEVAETVNMVSWLNQDCIILSGHGTVTPVAPNLTHLQSGDSSYIRGFTVGAENTSAEPWYTKQLNDYRGYSISATAGLTFDNLTSSNMKNLCYFAYTVSVPADGYYDMSTYLETGKAGASGYIIVVIDGVKHKYKVNDANSWLKYNRSNISAYLTAGDHTIAISGIFEHSLYPEYNGYTDWCNMGALSVSGGITKSETQIDPLTITDPGVLNNNGLIDGSAYSADTNKVISGVKPNTSAFLVKNNFKNTSIVSLKKNGIALSDDDFVGTGTVVEYATGYKYTIGAVSGDLSGDGKIDIRDMKLAKEHNFGDITTLSDAVFSAGDFANDGTIGTDDMNKLYGYIVGTDNDMFYSPITLGAGTLMSYANPVGRLVVKDNGVMMESSASNFTVSGNMKGNVTCTLMVNQVQWDEFGIFVEIDGNTANPTYIVLPANTTTTVTLATGLSEGYHTIKVSKSTDAKNDDIYVYGVTMNGKPAVTQAAEHRIEFIGDSITAGYAAKYPKTTSYYVYANYTADKLHADYYSVANGGWKFGEGSACLTDIYTKVSMHEDLGDYDFSYNPEVVVINVGTNDTHNNATPDANAQRRMLQTVRAKNPNATIIWAYGMIWHNGIDTIRNTVNQFAATDGNTYFVELPIYNDGTDNWHTGPEGNAVAADILSRYIANLKGWTLYE